MILSITTTMLLTQTIFLCISKAYHTCGSNDFENLYGICHRGEYNNYIGACVPICVVVVNPVKVRNTCKKKKTIFLVRVYFFENFIRVCIIIL